MSPLLPSPCWNCVCVEPVWALCMTSQSVLRVLVWLEDTTFLESPTTSGSSAISASSSTQISEPWGEVGEDIPLRAECSQVPPLCTLSSVSLCVDYYLINRKLLWKALPCITHLRMRLALVEPGKPWLACLNQWRPTALDYPLPKFAGQTRPGCYLWISMMQEVTPPMSEAVSITEAASLVITHRWGGDSPSGQ